MITVLPACQREVNALPVEVREDLADALTRLDNGLQLTMPLSRAMFTISKGLYELRLRDRTGAYRIFYFMKKQNDIFLVHAFKKTTQQTPSQTIATIKQRIKGL